MRALVLAFAVLLTMPREPLAATEDPWAAIAALRGRIESASPLAAEFVQTFVATGFTTGDSESGQVYLDLPACLRWDYGGDFPNSFLLCGHLAHGWNHGEKSGRRQFLSRDDEPGLDLLRLEVEELRKRYKARLVGLSGDLTVIELTAAGDEITEVRDATMIFAPGEPGLRSLDYHDLEGNLTRFAFSTYRPVEEQGIFAPPADLEWIQD